MRRSISLPTFGVIGLTLVIGVGTAQAQSQRAAAPLPSNSATTSGTVTDQQGPGLPPVAAHQDTYSNNNKEVFRLLGLSGQIAAPVTPPYNDNASYRTFAGQPMRGSDAVMAQSMDGAP